MQRWVRLFAFFALLLPGAWYAWRCKEMSHAGYYHDDGLYYVSAQTLAERGAYEIASLPQQPKQTKYPPLWPLILSIAWKIEPKYPDNLPWAMLLTWVWLPVSLFAYRSWLRQIDRDENTILLLGACWALNVYVILFSTTMLSEMLFTALLLSSLLCLRREQIQWTALAAILGGLAFLARSAGLALLPAVVIWLLLRKQWVRAGVFAAIMTPCILAWMVWSRQNLTSGTDEITLYYTNYVGYHLSVVAWNEFHNYLWRNTDGVLHGFGALLLPDVTFSFVEKALALTLGIAGISGIIRLLRQNPLGLLAPYAYFSALYTLMLIVWHFPPNERFVLPMAPLWLLGLYTEFSQFFRNVAQVFRKPGMGQKIAGAIMVLLLASVLGACASRQWDLLVYGMPAFFVDHAKRVRDAAPAMQYIRDHLPADAVILAENDPTVYLRTGRRGAGYILTTLHWYHEDVAARTDAYSDAAAYCKRLGIGYLLLNEWDYWRDIPQEAHETILKRLRSDSRLELLFRSGPTEVYRVR